MGAEIIYIPTPNVKSEKQFSKNFERVPGNFVTLRNDKCALPAQLSFSLGHV